MIDRERTMSARRTLEPALPADNADLDPDFEPEALRTIGDVATLKALSDPLRLRIIETMVQRIAPAWSVREIAAALDVPPTRLYHHVEQLVEHDLVRAVERRVVSGIIETRYRVVAHSFQLDRRLFAGGSEESRGLLHDTLTSIFDAARHEIEVAINLGAIEAGEAAPPERRVFVSHGLLRLTPARAAELRERLIALATEFDTTEFDAAGDEPGAMPFGSVLALYPLPPVPGASDD
jgi:DNA-binding transcriptional ArsR family regulator